MHRFLAAAFTSVTLISLCTLMPARAAAPSNPAADGGAALSPPGPKPKFSERLCARAISDTQEWTGRQPDEIAVQNILLMSSSRQITRLLSLVGDDVMWWVRTDGEVGVLSLPRALHEANHTVDLQLSACNGYNATYMLAGQVYVTELVRGTLPPYAIAAAKVPSFLKSQPLGRYASYFVRLPTVRGNDFTTLVDELNAYVTGAQLEVALAPTPLYSQDRKKYTTYDGNTGGMLDFMLFTLCYLKAVRESDPKVYERIQNSPRFLAHLQRLWLAAEQILVDVRPYLTLNRGFFLVDQETLDAVYSTPYIQELDKLSVRHMKTFDPRLTAR